MKKLTGLFCVMCGRFLKIRNINYLLCNKCSTEVDRIADSITQKQKDELKNFTACSECKEVLLDPFEIDFELCSFCSDEQLRVQREIHETNLSLYGI